MDELEEDYKDYRDLLSAYFDNDQQRRFRLERLIGAGGSALAWRIQYTSGDFSQKLVLKHDRAPADFDVDFIESLEAAADMEDPENPNDNERRWLTLLQWAKHVVRAYNIPDDPLARILPLRPHRIEHWNFLEWIENGTINNFITRAVESGYQTLPNRLLWRFFLCLIRMCIAMGWPPQPANGVPCLEHVGSGNPRNIMHSDLHDENILVDSVDPLSTEEEHDLSPPLKMIDLGSTQEIPTTDDYDPVKENIWEIGVIMSELVFLSVDAWNPAFISLDNSRDFQPSPGAPSFKTAAVGLLPNEQGHDLVPFLDRDLKVLICRCLAVKHQNRPRPAVLADVVMRAIRERDAAWYYREGSGHRSPAMEEDLVIRVMFQACIRDAPTT